MSWPDEHTAPFYVHDRQCLHCGRAFQGFARSKWCSPKCQEMARRARYMIAWGVPKATVKRLTDTLPNPTDRSS